MCQRAVLHRDEPVKLSDLGGCRQGRRRRITSPAQGHVGSSTARGVVAWPATATAAPCATGRRFFLCTGMRCLFTGARVVMFLAVIEHSGDGLVERGAAHRDSFRPLYERAAGQKGREPGRRTTDLPPYLRVRRVTRRVQASRALGREMRCSRSSDAPERSRDDVAFRSARAVVGVPRSRLDVRVPQRLHAASGGLAAQRCGPLPRHPRTGPPAAGREGTRARPLRNGSRRAS